MATIKNPLKLNDWPIKSFLVVILSIQLAYIGIFGMNNFDIETLFLRQVLGFVYITFIPGYLLLRILRVHRLSSEESFLYAVGLSLFFDMFVGFLMNTFYPLLGITDKPISEIPVMITFTLATLLLSIWAYFRDRDYCTPDFINLKDILSPQFLFLSLVPFLAIFGTYLMNYYRTNMLLMIMIIVIALVALLIGFTNLIPEKLYSYAIWVIAISLIFHTTLIGSYIKIFDGEGYVPKIVMQEGFLDFDKYSSNYFAVIENTILVPIMICVVKLNLIWVYKLIFPFLLSIMPVGLYCLFSYIKLLENKKEIFLGVFLYMIHSTFFELIPFLKKQLSAMFFLVLFLIMIFNNNINRINKNILALIFGISILWSHYGTAYLIMFMLLFILVEGHILNNINNKTIVTNITLIYSAILLTWYMYVSNSSVIATVTNIGVAIINTIRTEFLVLEASRGAVALTNSPHSIWSLLQRILFFLVFFLICVGYINSALSIIIQKKREYDIQNLNALLYTLLSLYWFIIMSATIVIPFFAVMNPHRLYSLAYIQLIPFSVVGAKRGCSMFNLVSKYFLIRRNLNMFKKTCSLHILFALGVMYLLLSTGFVNELTKIDPKSISLSQESILTHGDIERRGYYYSFLIHPYDVQSVRWLSTKRDQNKKICATIGFMDTVGVFSPYGGIFYTELCPIRQNSKYLYKDSYIYLYMLNVKGNIGVDVDPYATHLIWYSITEMYVYPLLKNQNKIYDNGGSQVVLT